MKNLLRLSWVYLFGITMSFAQQPQLSPLVPKKSITLDFEKPKGDYQPKYDSLHARSGRAALRVQFGSVYAQNPIRFFFKENSNVKIEAYAHFQSKKASTAKSMAKAGAISANIGSAAPLTGEGLRLSTSVQPLQIAIGAAIVATRAYRNSIVPRAFMNLNWFNLKRELLHTETVPLTKEARNQWQLMQSNYRPQEAGYVEVAFVNTDAQTVWFDDLTASDIGYYTGGVDCGFPNQPPCTLPDFPIIGVPDPPQPGSPSPDPYSPTPPYTGGGGDNGGSSPGSSGFPDNPVQGQKFSTLDGDGVFVEYEYRCQGSSCVWRIFQVVLPQVTVTTQPNKYANFPLYPVDGQKIYGLTDGQNFVYTYVDITGHSGLWSGRAVDPYRETQVYSVCDGYAAMLRIQSQENREVVGWVTADGRLFIMPLTDGSWTNTVDRSLTSNIISDVQGRVIVSVTQAQSSDLPNRLPGMWYLDYTTFDSNGNPMTTTHVISHHVHTHPAGPNQNIPSTFDEDFAGASGNEFAPGIPKYILNNTNLIKYNRNGAENSQPNNCR
ncbi:MAG: hypothetical protein MUD08_10440 [Cytophagales bacterium]|jgi:hypothetical protein|nr:hypothetical protein [Cytophagales bacterium]